MKAARRAAPLCCAVGTAGELGGFSKATPAHLHRHDIARRKPARSQSPGFGFWPQKVEFAGRGGQSRVESSWAKQRGGGRQPAGCTLVSLPPSRHADTHACPHARAFAFSEFRGSGRAVASCASSPSPTTIIFIDPIIPCRRCRFVLTRPSTHRSTLVPRGYHHLSFHLADRLRTHLPNDSARGGHDRLAPLFC